MRTRTVLCITAVILAAIALTTNSLVARGELSYKLRNHDPNPNLVTDALALLAPSQNDHSLVIHRIRLSSNASSTTPSYIFVSRQIYPGPARAH